jgi:hypothetical protein
LVLFDRSIVKSFRLRELPFLVRAFGKSGIIELLNSGLLKLSCEFTSLITDIHRNGIRSDPLGHFTFGIADAADRESDLRKEFAKLQSVSGLKNKERRAIEEAAWSALIRPPATFGTDLLQQLDTDRRTNSPSLRLAILQQLRQDLALQGVQVPDLQITVEEVKHRVFHLKTGLSTHFGLSPEKTHQLLQTSVTEVANLNHRLAEMTAYSALTGFL